MNIRFTENAEENLGDIYLYHCEFSKQYAETFNNAILEFVMENLSSHPNIGHIYNQQKNLYRLIFKRRYNIYYSIEDKNIYVLYILDGRLDLNIKLQKSDIELTSID